MAKINTRIEISQSILRSFEIDFIQRVGLSLKDARESKMVHFKKSRVPFSKLKYLIENETISSHLITIEKNGKKLPGKRQIFQVFSHLSFSIQHDEKEIAKYNSMREYEDALTEKYLLEHDLKKEAQAKKPIDEFLINELQQNLDPIVKEYCNLAFIYKKFQHLPNFFDNIQSVIETYHKCNDDPNTKKSYRGKLFELKSLHILLNEQEIVVGIGIKYRSPSESANYDIELYPNVLIECKYSEYDIDKKKMIEKMRVAQAHKKKLVFFFYDEVSLETKKLLNSHQIDFRDGLSKVPY